MKKPKFLSKLSAVLTPRPKRKIHATARAARSAQADDYDEEEPTTKLSSAFIVVLILHVVAVGGIYAFNSIKASRKERDSFATTTAAPASATADAPAASAQPAVPASITDTNVLEPLPPVPVAGLSTAKGGVPKQHVIKSKETLTKIAAEYGVTTADLAAANHMKQTDVLQPGRMLAIPESKTAAKPASTESVKAMKAATTTPKASAASTKESTNFYTVKKGDTATGIARKLGVTTTQLLDANKGTDPRKLQVGQTLKVPARKD